MLLIPADFTIRTGAWSLADILVLIVLVAAAVAVVYVALRKFGITVPDWLVTISCIVLVALVAIAAIRFIFSLG